MPHKANPDHFTELEYVTTLAQACRETGIPRQTISYAIDAGNLAAVRVGKVVLISVRSLRDYAQRLALRS